MHFSFQSCLKECPRCVPMSLFPTKTETACSEIHFWHVVYFNDSFPLKHIQQGSVLYPSNIYLHFLDKHGALSALWKQLTHLSVRFSVYCFREQITSRGEREWNDGQWDRLLPCMLTDLSSIPRNAYGYLGPGGVILGHRVRNETSEHLWGWPQIPKSLKYVQFYFLISCFLKNI